MARSFPPILGLLIRLALLAGLLLLSWGPDDPRGFFAHPARSGGMLVGVLVGVFATLFCRHIRPLPKGKQSVGGLALLAWIVFVLLLMVWLPYGDRWGLLVFRRALADPLRYSGLALLAAGVAVRLVALPVLGKHLCGHVTVQEDHQLAQTGIYSRIRHPMYLGLLLITPGVALIFRSWLAIPAFLASVAFIGIRIQQEEKLLGEHFGAEFEAYRRRTWRLVPFLY